jgi:3-dehydroquinate dehydratase / shikimate dehydrogenase
MTQICVPIMVETHSEALRDATLAAEHGADLVEFRVDVFFEDRSDDEKGMVEQLHDRIDRVLDLVEVSPVPCIVTCRPHWEGGEYHGDDADRIALYEALGTSDSPPAYVDVELATFTRTPEIKARITRALTKADDSPATRLILSTHDFERRPSDLTRKIMAMQDEPACSVVKVAYRARSIRDNLELFEILRDRQKPTIALGMGQFGVMSRILAPKFGGFLTFASLRDESTTAPGQITIDELLGLYRFRSITPTTKVYGIIGWPITQSMSPMVHNAGFEAIGWDGVYVPMPVEGSYESFKATISILATHQQLHFSGASVTIPHKQNAIRLMQELAESQRLDESATDPENLRNTIKASNTISNIRCDERGDEFEFTLHNTDTTAIESLITQAVAPRQMSEISAHIYGAGGVARAAAYPLAALGASLYLFNRSFVPAHNLYTEIEDSLADAPVCGDIYIPDAEKASLQPCDLLINCTPVGMTDGPDPDGLSIPIPDMPNLAPETVFFDTVYNPIETPMLKAAKERGYHTIDGVQMFVKQAEAQFEIWTGQSAPDGLSDRLVRERLGG